MSIYTFPRQIQIRFDTRLSSHKLIARLLAGRGAHVAPSCLARVGPSGKKILVFTSRREFPLSGRGSPRDPTDHPLTSRGRGAHTI